MTLEDWLHLATKGLAAPARARVRTEIQEHYEAARGSALERGANADEADRAALLALGDPATTNRQYRDALLTSVEWRMLQESGSEARAVCAGPALKWMLLAAPVSVLVGSAILAFNGAHQLAGILLSGGLALTLLFGGPLLPMYTPRRAFVYRIAKWFALLVLLLVAFPPFERRSVGMLSVCLWPILWNEWTRLSIRRKLPVREWPKHLYL